MPGDVINESILIIASVILIGALVGPVYIGITYAGSSISSSALMSSQKLLTDVQIDYASNTSSTSLLVFVQNVGGVPVANIGSSTMYFGLENQEAPIGFGGPAPNWNTSVATLNPGQTMQVNITLSQALATGQFYTVMYVTPNGVSSSYTFQVS